MDKSSAETAGSNWQSLYKIGGMAALIAVLVGIMEIAITFLPGGNASPETVIDWFMLFQNNWFLGLRNLGLLNILLDALGVLIFFALYGAHRQVNKTYATLALIISILGTAVFYATNRAFPMLDLSNQYAAATTESQRIGLAAAGQAMLSVGGSHTPGTFLAFFLLEVSGIGMSLVMLRSKIFSRASAYAGMLGFGLLLIFEICSSFIPAVEDVAMIIVMLGGLSSMVWYILIARRLFQLGRGVS
ncbi:MAG: DUF4386 family protein [Chloroflexota bacterium]